MNNRPIRVLLVEDNPGDVCLIREMLAEANETDFALEEAARLSVAHDRLNREDVDLVLLDLSLPDSSGLETFQKIRIHVPSVPIVVLSGLNDETLAVKAVQSGAQDYLVKGQVDSNVLVRSIRYAIERKRAEETIRKLAYFDPLTGLPNRILFNDRLALALAHAQRNKQKLAVMLLDLDRFKNVNDSLGHNTGDQLLKAVGEELVLRLRREDTVARMGGDEFLLLLPEVFRIEDVENLAKKILGVFHRLFVIDDHELEITASMGISVYPDDGQDVDTLLKNADIAMYKVKERGRDGFQNFSGRGQSREEGGKAYLHKSPKRRRELKTLSQNIDRDVPGAAPARVLLVEDDPGDVRIIREQLSETTDLTFHVEEVDRLSRAIEFLSQGDPDIILLDLNLPDSSGFDTLARIQEQVWRSPVIVLTGNADQSLAAQAVREGAQDYLVKGSVDGKTLGRSIRNAMERQRAEEAYRLLVDHSIQGLIILQGIPPGVAFANAALAEICGSTVEDILSIGPELMARLLYHEDRSMVLQRYADLLAGRSVPRRFAFRMTRRDGELRWLEILVNPIIYRDQPAIQAAVIDITERRRAEEMRRMMERQYRLTLDAMSDAIHVVDRQMRFVLLNSTFRRWNKELGLMTDVTGRTVFEVFPFLPENVLAEYERVFKEGNVLVTEECTKVGSREFLTETRKIPIYENGSVQRIVTVIRDITGRRWIHEKTGKAAGNA